MKTNPQQLIHAYKNAPWRVQLQFIGIFSLIVVLVALIAGVYLNVTARAATIGREIQDMEANILELQRDNADLENQLGLLTSIRTMERRAEDLGFQPINPAEVLYITVPGYAGRQAVSLAPPPGPVAASDSSLPPEYTQTLFDWLKETTLNPMGDRPLDWFTGWGVRPVEAKESGGSSDGSP
jgi:cell division protein FtsL